MNLKFKKIILAIVAVLSLTVISVSAKTVNYEELEVNLSEVDNGTYKGIAPGRSGMIKVYVRVENNDISQVYLASHRDSIHQRVAVAEAFAKLPAEIASRNNVNVDTVAGATKTSNGIINAVKVALNSKPLDGEDLIPEWQKFVLSKGNTVTSNIFTAPADITGLVSAARMTALINEINESGKTRVLFNEAITLTNDTDINLAFGSDIEQVTFADLSSEQNVTFIAENAHVTINGGTLSGNVTVQAAPDTVVLNGVTVNGSLTVEKGSLTANNANLGAISIPISNDTATSVVFSGNTVTQKVTVESTSITEVKVADNAKSELAIDTGVDQVINLAITTREKLPELLVKGSGSAAVIVENAEVKITTSGTVSADVKPTNGSKVEVSSGSGCNAVVKPSGDASVIVAGSNASVDVSEAGSDTNVSVDNNVTVKNGGDEATTLPENTVLVTTATTGKFFYKGNMYDVANSDITKHESISAAKTAATNATDYIILGNVPLGGDVTFDESITFTKIGNVTITYGDNFVTAPSNIIGANIEIVGEGTNYYHDDLAKVINKEGSSKINLFNDVTLSSTITISKEMTIDLNNKSITVSDFQDIFIITTSEAVNISNGRIVNNTSLNKSDKIFPKHIGISPSTDFGYNLTVDNVKFEGADLNSSIDVNNDKGRGVSNLTVKNSNFSKTANKTIQRVTAKNITITENVFNGGTTQRRLGSGVHLSIYESTVLNFTNNVFNNKTFGVEITLHGGIDHDASKIETAIMDKVTSETFNNTFNNSMMNVLAYDYNNTNVEGDSDEEKGLLKDLVIPDQKLNGVNDNQFINLSYLSFTNQIITYKGHNFSKTSANANSLEEFKAALVNDKINKIVLYNNITLDERLDITKDLTIESAFTKDYTLTADLAAYETGTTWDQKGFIDVQEGKALTLKNINIAGEIATTVGTSTARLITVRGSLNLINADLTGFTKAGVTTYLPTTVVNISDSRITTAVVGESVGQCVTVFGGIVTISDSVMTGSVDNNNEYTSSSISVSTLFNNNASGTSGAPKLNVSNVRVTGAPSGIVIDFNFNIQANNIAIINDVKYDAVTLENYSDTGTYKEHQVTVDGVTYAVGYKCTHDHSEA